MKKLWVLIFLTSFCSAIYAKDKLIFALDLIRHGDRSPIKNIPTINYKWPNGLGQLTPIGMHQEYLLGQRFRKIYVDTYHLLPSRFDIKSIYVRSTDYDRTLMSAQSLLTGLYPRGTGPNLPGSSLPTLPNAIQPIPIHTIPKDLDDLLIAEHNVTEFNAAEEKYIYPSLAWKKKTSEVSSDFARWQAATGVKINTLDDVISVGNTLYIDRLHHAPLPSTLTEAEVSKIIAVGKWAFVQEYMSPEIGKITSTLLLKTIMEYLKAAATKKDSLKYVLFSAHDTTSLGLASVLQSPLQEAPPYASDFNFSLFKNSTGHYFVNITFNGKALPIPACNHTNTCSLAQLEVLTKQKNLNTQTDRHRGL